MCRQLIAFALSLLVWIAAACSSDSGSNSDLLTADVRGIGGSRTASGAPVPGTVGAGPSGNVGGGTDAVQREIAEADVFAVDGDRLILLNAWRGLAVVDLSQFTLLGRLPLHGMPHEVHLLGSRALVLVGAAGGSSNTRLVEVDLSDVQNPVNARETAMPGWFRTSRRVGQALYVLTSDGAQSFGLAATPFTDVAAQALPGENLFAHATTDRLFVAGQNGAAASIVSILDIGSPTGQMLLRGTIALPGHVLDDQKLHFGGGCLRVVTQENALSRLFTIDVADADAPARLGELTFARGEQQFGSCFDDHRAYIVTFERIDPLWVVDLADARHPRMAGELQVPGFSTQIVCRGDRLIGLGFADAFGMPAVSLFDVAQPDRPTLLSRVEIPGVAYEAFGERRSMLVGDTTVLVPTWDGLAVLDRTASSLTLRGEFTVRGGARRGLVHGRGIVAIGNERVVVADPAALNVRGEIAIASNVVDVARLADGSLLELVQTGEVSRLRDAEVPMWPEKLFVHGQSAAIIGWDRDGRAVRTVDLAAVPPRVSGRIGLGYGRYAAPLSPRSDAPMANGTIAGGYYTNSGDVQLADGLLLARGVPESVGVAIGSGEATDGFAVVDIAGGRALPGLAVHDAAITGMAVDGTQLALTVAQSAGFDAPGRPLLRNQLWQVEPRTARAELQANVPGFVVAKAGDRVFTIEERWRLDWTVAMRITALRLADGRADRLKSTDLGDGAWDFRQGGGSVFYSWARSVLTPWQGSMAWLPGIAIDSVRLTDQLPRGPRLADDVYRRILVADGGHLLVEENGLNTAIWDMTGSEAVRLHTRAVDGYVASAVADATQPGRYVLALGYAGSAIVP